MSDTNGCNEGVEGADAVMTDEDIVALVKDMKRNTLLTKQERERIIAVCLHAMYLHALCKDSLAWWDRLNPMTTIAQKLRKAIGK